MEVIDVDGAETFFGAPEHPFCLRLIEGEQEMDVLWGKRQLIGSVAFAGATQADALKAASDYALETGCYLVPARLAGEPERTLRVLAELAVPATGPVVRLREWLPHSLGGKEYRELPLEELERTSVLEVEGHLQLDGDVCVSLLAKMQATLAGRGRLQAAFTVPKRVRLSALAERQSVSV